MKPETLRALIEDFVSREGTDYGQEEVSFETKIEQVMCQLRDEKAVISFDPDNESCTIVRASAIKE